MIEKAKQLLTEAVRTDSKLVIYYSGDPEMFVEVVGTHTAWRSEGSTRKEVEMTEAMQNLQANELLEEGWFGRGTGRSFQFSPTAKAFMGFAGGD